MKSSTCWVLMGVITLALYGAHVRWAEFVWEDARWVQAGAAWGGRRGLANLSWRLVSDPGPSHLLNVALHLGNVALVVGLARRLGLRGWAYGVGALFLLHPLTTQAVAYASGRAELLAAGGVLLACVLAAGAWTRWTVAGMTLAGLWGVLSKESAIVALILVPLVAAEVHRQVRYRWLAAAGVVSVVAGCAWYTDIGYAPGASLSWTHWVQMQSLAAVRLLSMLVVPMHQTIDFDYDVVWHIGLPAVGTVGLAAMYALVSRSFAVGWMLVVILPRLIVQTPRSYLNEHQFYLAVVGFALFVGTMLQQRAHTEAADGTA